MSLSMVGSVKPGLLSPFLLALSHCVGSGSSPQVADRVPDNASAPPLAVVEGANLRSAGSLAMTLVVSETEVVLLRGDSLSLAEDAIVLRADPREADDHLVPELKEGIEKLIGELDEVTQPSPPTALVAVAPTVEMALLVDVLFTAGQAGVSAYAFAVSTSQGPRALGVKPPRACTEPTGSADACVLPQLSVASDGVFVSARLVDRTSGCDAFGDRSPPWSGRVLLPAGGSCPSAAKNDLAAVRSLIDDLAKLGPPCPYAWFSAENDVPWSDLAAMGAWLEGVLDYSPLVIAAEATTDCGDTFTVRAANHRPVCRELVTLLAKRVGSLGKGKPAITPVTTLAEDLGLDDLQRVETIMAVGAAFEVQIDDQRMLEFLTIQDLADEVCPNAKSPAFGRWRGEGIWAPGIGEEVEFAAPWVHVIEHTDDGHQAVGEFRYTAAELPDGSTRLVLDPVSAVDAMITGPWRLTREGSDLQVAVSTGNPSHDREARLGPAVVPAPVFVLDPDLLGSRVQRPNTSRTNSCVNEANVECGRLEAQGGYHRVFGCRELLFGACAALPHDIGLPEVTEDPAKLVPWLRGLAHLQRAAIEVAMKHVSSHRRVADRDLLRAAVSAGLDVLDGWADAVDRSNVPAAALQTAPEREALAKAILQAATTLALVPEGPGWSRFGPHWRQR
jgi:acyl carrier protein